jgi:hypothetical protein
VLLRRAIENLCCNNRADVRRVQFGKSPYAVTQSFAPCRLFVGLALRAPAGVVPRRGPSRRVQPSVWHTDTKTFEHGQWMRGRVYERRCDVSPDGSLFAYFVRKDGVRSANLEQVDSWAAISRPPWFAALALWTAPSPR